MSPEFGITYTYDSAQRNEIDRHSWAKVICDNTDVTSMPREAFDLMAPSEYTSCDDIPGLDLEAWREDRNSESSILLHYLKGLFCLYLFKLLAIV